MYAIHSWNKFQSQRKLCDVSGTAFFCRGPVYFLDNQRFIRVLLAVSTFLTECSQNSRRSELLLFHRLDSDEETDWRGLNQSQADWSIICDFSRPFCSDKFRKHWLNKSAGQKTLKYFDYPGGTSCRAFQVEFDLGCLIKRNTPCIKGTQVLQNSVSRCPNGFWPRII